MHKLVVLYPQPSEPENFLAYYETKHQPLVQYLPGLISSSYGRVDNPNSEYFVVFEAVFNDLPSLQEALGSQAGKNLAADIPNYSPKGAVILTLETC